MNGNKHWPRDPYRFSRGGMTAITSYMAPPPIADYWFNRDYEESGICLSSAEPKPLENEVNADSRHRMRRARRWFRRLPGGNRRNSSRHCA